MYSTKVSLLVSSFMLCSAGGAASRPMIKTESKKAGSVIGLPQDTLDITIAKRMRTKLNTILSFEGHPLYKVFKDLRSKFSNRFLMPIISTERMKKSFVPAAVKFLNVNAHH